VGYIIGYTLQYVSDDRNLDWIYNKEHIIPLVVLEIQIIFLGKIYPVFFTLFLGSLLSFVLICIQSNILSCALSKALQFTSVVRK